MLPEQRVRIFGITPVGLASLTLGVCALWGCFAVEKVTTNRARNDMRASLRQIQRLRQDAQPVSRPSNHFPARPAAA
jgi:hypothetical protein